jgi:hypothetical protein
MKPTPLLLCSCLLTLPVLAQGRPTPRGGATGGVPMGPARGEGVRGGSVNPAPGSPMERAPRPQPREASPSPFPSAKARDTAPLRYYPGTRVVMAPAWDRCTTLPDMGYWGRRDLFNEIQWISRKGFIGVTEVGPTVTSLTDVSETPAGWKAYGVAIPPGGKLNVELSHPNLGWFRLMAVRKDGTPGPGMLNAIAAYRPVAFTLANPTSEAGAVYIIVDDPGWMSSKDSPYTLTFTRSWDPATTDLSSVKMVVGIWGASPSVSARFQGPSLTGPAVYPN